LGVARSAALRLGHGVDGGQAVLLGEIAAGVRVRRDLAQADERVS